MLQEIEKFASEFLEASKSKPIRVISHFDTDGITSAAIIIKTLKRLDKKFSVKIVKSLEEENLKKELEKNTKEVILFTDLASGSLDYFQTLKDPIFILDHHELDKTKLNEKIKIINPHLYGDEETTGAGLSYLFSKAISKNNTDLAHLAMIGIVGDRHENQISKINNQILQDIKDLTIKKSLMIYPATRPLRRTLEYCTSIYIPGVTGSSSGVFELLRETNIAPDKSLIDLTEEETSRLLTAIFVRRANCNSKEEIIGNLYLLKFFNRKEDARELSVMINACSRMGQSDMALAFCLENQNAKANIEEIYTEYKQQLISALGYIEKLDKVNGNGFVIMNAKDNIKDTIIGTVTSMLSSSLNYKEGTVLIGMAYTQDKIKVSARIVGREGRNLKELLEKVTLKFNGEVGGHMKAAGCIIKKESEQEFIESLKKDLEIIEAIKAENPSLETLKNPHSY